MMDTPKQTCQCDYPDLTKDDLKAAQTYYTEERAEIDARDRISKL